MLKEIKIPKNIETINQMFPIISVKLCAIAECPAGRCSMCILAETNHKEFTKWFKNQIINS